MEEKHGQDVYMRDIAKAAGISRQALYLHFTNRTDLMIATVQYVDEVKGLYDKLTSLEEAKTSTELLERCVDIWCNYIPEIYGMAKALLKTRDTDEATAAAWDGAMGCLRDLCETIIKRMEKEKILDPKWSRREAVDMMMTIISFYNWEQLVMEYGWSQKKYIKWIKTLLKQTFIKDQRA